MESYSSAKGRRSMILQKLKADSQISVSDLSKEFKVSEVTIRKDLNILSSRNLLVRTHGGAILDSQHQVHSYNISIDKKKLLRQREKQLIGHAAASLIKDGDTILLDSGTTTLEVARNLSPFTDLTIITNSINIASELLAYNRFNVIVLGGNVMDSSRSTVGPIAESNLKLFYCDKLFLGVDSFSIENGLSTPDIEEANINQNMMKRSKEVIAVFDSSKLNRRALAYITSIDSINTIVTDSEMPEEICNTLSARGIRVILV